MDRGPGCPPSKGQTRTYAPGAAHKRRFFSWVAPSKSSYLQRSSVEDGSESRIDFLILRVACVHRSDHIGASANALRDFNDRIARRIHRGPKSNAYSR